MLTALMLRESGMCLPKEMEVMQATQRTFSLDTCKLKDFARSHTGGVNCLELEKNEGRYLLSGGGKGSVVIYDTWNTSGTPKHQYEVICSVPEKYKHQYSVETVQWYPFDNGLFTTSASDKVLKIWDANALVPVESYEFNGIVYSHHMSTCATEHNLITVGTSSSQAKIIDMRTGSSIQILKGHNKSVYCVKWSPCLPFIVTTGSLDGRILFWDIRMAKGQMVSLDQHNGKKSVGCAHTGHVLAMEYLETGYGLLSYGSDDTIRLWDAFTGKNQMINYGKVYNDVERCLKMTVSTGTHEPVLFIPEGEKIRSFDVMSGQHIKTLSGHFRQVNCCHYNSFTQEVYSGSNDRNLLVWTPDHAAEDKYMQCIEEDSKQATKSLNKSAAVSNEGALTSQSLSRPTSIQQSQNLSSVLADTWSDDEGD